MRISKSRFMQCYQCNKAGWLYLHRPEIIEKDSQTEELFDTGSEVGKLARSIIGEYVLVETVSDKEKMLNDTSLYIASGVKIIAEASFSSNGCFCSTDIIKVVDLEKKILDVYEVKSTTKVKPEHLIDMAFQYQVITGCGYHIRNFYHVHINSNYMRDDKLDLNQLFNIVNCYPDVIANLDKIVDNVDNYKSLLDSKEEPNVSIGCQCDKPYKCPFFSYCLRQKKVPKPSVFDLHGKGATFAKKVDMFSNGIITFEDILSRKPSLNQARMNEIECAVKKENMPVKMEELKEFMKTFIYPINFLDFESYQTPIPEWEWQKPFMQIPFQYSLHILYEDGTLEHKEYIAPVGTDAQSNVRDRLLNDLTETGSIVAYNSPFEKMVISEIADASPLLYRKLTALKKRFIDLMDPFAKQWIYMNAFKGSYSIKYVLPALFPDDNELNYKNLDVIQNGSIAMKVYENMKNLSAEEQELMYKRLYAYCGLDTYALVKIFWFLLDLVAGKTTLPPAS